jgi:sorbitol-specific phosphotransferase system component IIC
MVLEVKIETDQIHIHKADQIHILKATNRLYLVLMTNIVIILICLLLDRRLVMLVIQVKVK